jgi:biopolymer transport protein ExbB/TolQ
MRIFRNGRLVIGFSIALLFWINFFGCATSSRIQALEEKNQLTLDKVEEALKECQGAKAAVEDSSRYSAESAANAQRAEAAASRAETSALQAKKAARAAESSANRAEDSANKAENSAKKTADIYDRIIAK